MSRKSNSMVFARFQELGYRRILFKRLLFLWRLARQLPPSDLLMYVDGNDVLFQRPVDSAVKAWQELVAGDPPGDEPVMIVFESRSLTGRSFRA